jgi:hypothetical protein
METQVQSAAANIMFILDNSGSMDWEYLTQGTDGKFEGNIEYVFDSDPGDNTYPTSDSNGTILSGSDRGKWKSQWSGYNKIYYNPNTAYLPWPQTTTNPFADADISNPRSNPANATPTFDLTAEYHSIAGYDGEVIVDNTDAGFSVSDESHWGTSTYANDIGNNYRFNEIRLLTPMPGPNGRRHCRRQVITRYMSGLGPSPPVPARCILYHRARRRPTTVSCISHHTD